MESRIYSPTQQAGALMIEVLVTISIVIIGLWGLMEVQTRDLLLFVIAADLANMPAHLIF